jgi:hypothetical protein
MSQFLWIEDFEYGTKHAKNVFGHILQNADIPTTKPKLKHLLKDYRVSVELSFLEGLRFIREQLSQVDYIILDIDLIDIPPGLLRYEEQTDLLALLEQFYDYQPHQDKSLDEANYKKAAEQLKPEAGYKLYVELVIALGFPKEHILFCSNHTNEQKQIKSVFEKAKIDLPLTFSKDEKNAVQNWITERRNNPYSVLRRGIIEGCQDIKSLIQNPDNIQFGEFTHKNAHKIAQDMQDYLDILLKLLPLREPQDKEPLYKLFVRTLAHEWETSANPESFSGENKNRNKTFAWVMKNTRNWISHSDFLNDLKEQDIAFLFIVAMRAMFSLESTTQNHEKILLALFEQERLSADNFKNCIKNKEIPLMDTYLAVRNASLNAKIPVKEASPFRKMLDEMQSRNIPHNYIRGLFQIFWHGLFPITLSGTPENKVKKINQTTFLCEMKCQFCGDYNFDHKEFLFEFARSIYKRSFPV